jgi:hypothetical protein
LFRPQPGEAGVTVTVPCRLQIKVKKADSDLLIEQLREVFRVLAVDKVQVTKLDKRLDDVTQKWSEVKKLQPQVKNNVEPVQVGGARVRKAVVFLQPCALAKCTASAAARGPSPAVAHRDAATACFAVCRCILMFASPGHGVCK